MKRKGIHIPVGTVLLALAVLTGVCSVVRGAELPVADTPHYKTTAYLSALPNASAAIEVSNLCTRERVTVAPEGVAKLDLSLCGTADFGLITAPENVDSFVKITTDYGPFVHSFTVPPLDSFRTSQRAMFEESGTWVTILCSADTPLTATVYDGQHPSIYAYEYFTCTKPATVYEVKARGLGTFRISIGYVGILDFPNLPSVHGFVTYTDANGFGNGQAVPLK